MPYKPKKQTPAHKKQLERVRQFIRRAEKRGFRFTDDFKSSLKELKTVQLKALKPEKLYSLSTALSETGDIVSGTERRREERSLSAKKSAQTRKKKKQKQNQEYYPDGGDIIYGNIVEEFIERLQTPTPEYATATSGRNYKRSSDVINESERQKAFLLNLTFQVAREIGTSALGWRLQERATDVSSLTDYILYGSTSAKIQSASTELASIIKGSQLTLKERIDLAEQEEFNEDWELPE